MGTVYVLQCYEVLFRRVLSFAVSTSNVQQGGSSES